MIKYFSQRNAQRYRTKSLQELNEVTAAIADDLEDIEAALPSFSFDNNNGLIISTESPGAEENSGNSPQGG